MLTTLAAGLQRGQKRLVLARASAEARELVTLAAEEAAAIVVYPTLDDALRSLESRPTEQAA